MLHSLLSALPASYPWKEHIRYFETIDSTNTQAKELAATKALIWPLFYTGVFYLIFVGALTVILGRVEKKLSYFRS